MNKISHGNSIRPFKNKTKYTDENSSIWWENFIRIYFEREIPQHGLSLPALQIRRMLTMCVHKQGQLLNTFNLAESMNLAHPTIRRYIDLIEQRFILRILKTFRNQYKKEINKIPQSIYTRFRYIKQTLVN